MSSFKIISTGSKAEDVYGGIFLDNFGCNQLNNPQAVEKNTARKIAIYSGQFGTGVNYLPFGEYWVMQESGNHLFTEENVNLIPRNLIDDGNLKVHWKLSSEQKRNVSESLIDELSISVKDEKDSFIKNYKIQSFSTGFNSSGVSGYFGTGNIEKYYSTGSPSGYAGAGTYLKIQDSGYLTTGYLESWTGYTGSGNLNVIETGSGDSTTHLYGDVYAVESTFVPEIFAVLESGYLENKKTYIDLQGLTGQSGQFAVLEQGFSIEKTKVGSNQFNIPSSDLLGLTDPIKIGLSFSTIGGETFSTFKKFKILPPKVVNSFYSHEGDQVTAYYKADSTSEIEFLSSDYSERLIYNSTQEQYNSTTFYHQPNSPQKYFIRPFDRLGSGELFEGEQINIPVNIKNVNASEINFGGDPELKISWNVEDNNNKSQLKFYSYKVGFFNPNSSGFLTNPINLDQENISTISPDLTISGESGNSKLVTFNSFSNTEVGERQKIYSSGENAIVRFRSSEIESPTRDVGIILYAVDSNNSVFAHSKTTGTFHAPQATNVSVDNSISRQLKFDFDYYLTKENISKTEIYTGSNSNFEISQSNLVRTLASNEQSFTENPPLTGSTPPTYSSNYYYKFLPYDNFGSGLITTVLASVQVPDVPAPIIIENTGFETTGINGTDLSEIYLRWTGDSRIDYYSVEISEPQHPSKKFKQTIDASNAELRFIIEQSDVHNVNISGYLNTPDNVYTDITSLSFTGNSFSDFKIRSDVNFLGNNQKDFFINSSGFGSTGSTQTSINLGSASTIEADTGGNIDFKSDTGDGATSLFNIASDPDTPSVFKSDLEIHMPETGYGITGHKLYFGTSSQNTDPIYLTRFDTESDDSELRLYLGDNHGDSSNYDKFLVGGVAYPSENLSTVFSVTTQNDTGAVGILTDSPIFPFHIKASVPGTEHTYIASIDNESNDGGGLWLEVGDNDNSEDALRISNPNTTENLLRIKSQSGIFIAYDQLPSIDPEVKGQLYRDASNFLKISAG